MFDKQTYRAFSVITCGVVKGDQSRPTIKHRLTVLHYINFSTSFSIQLYPEQQTNVFDQFNCNILGDIPIVKQTTVK